MSHWKVSITLVAIALWGGVMLFAFQQGGGQLEVIWGKQIGTSEEEGADDLTLDKKGNIYIAGWTGGNLFGQHQGKRDIFIVKMDSNGQILWSKQLGTAEEELCVKIATDGENVYLLTDTEGGWFGESLGRDDIILLKFSSDGQLLWGKRLGGSEQDFCADIAVDQQGNIYIIGNTGSNLFAKKRNAYEVFLAKFDAAGNLLWGKQFEDGLDAIVVDHQGNIYVSGGSYDKVNDTSLLVLAKFAPDGTMIWRQTLTAIAHEGIISLAVDSSGNLYGAGMAVGYLEEREIVISIPDAFLAKFIGADGQMIWSKKLKSKGEGEVNEEFVDVAVDEEGNVYVVGNSGGSLFGEHLGDTDVVLAKFDTQGNMIWGMQWGSAKGETGLAVAVDGQKNIYIAGATDSNQFGSNAGESDLYLAKFKQLVR